MGIRHLILILGDQLSHDLSSLNGFDPEQDHILMAEVMEEATYVRHHKKKIAFLFSAMRHFYQELRHKGYAGTYFKLNEKGEPASFRQAVERVVKKHEPEKILVTLPGEYRVLQEVQSWRKAFNIEVEIIDDDRFFCTPDAFTEWAGGRKSLRMEHFYRGLRKKHFILMDDDAPAGGQWNFDQDNRKRPSEDLKIPPPYTAQVDKITESCLHLVSENFADHFGDLEPFPYAVTRTQALYALDKFMEERLPCFGDYQDAMLQGEAWMFHAHISLYLNCGLLTPRECCEKAERAYQDGQAPLNAVEGFIRQILGWREFVRGIYWHHMPDYRSENFFSADRTLPDYFWTGETRMNCLRQVISETKQNAYAHHIQRLMVIGNFCLLTGMDPAEVNEWFLIVYADAYEWVELPNVTGMALFADGGVFASKPYISSGSYINKMSDYCIDCAYSVSKKTGETACPFNYLYWNFLLLQREKLNGNARLNMAYSSLDKMSDEKIENIRSDAGRFLKKLEEGKVV